MLFNVVFTSLLELILNDTKHMVAQMVKFIRLLLVTRKNFTTPHMRATFWLSSQGEAPRHKRDNPATT